MGVRLFLPLTGPFVAVSKSRAEKIIERNHRRDQRANLGPRSRLAVGAIMLLYVVVGLVWVAWTFDWRAGVAMIGLMLLGLSKLLAHDPAASDETATATAGNDQVAE